MSKRRMFSPDIVSSDAFVDMPMSAQALYFHLCLNADDDGFIGRPKQICRMVGANDDDLKILYAKRFLLQFESSVAVVKHWLIMNLIRADLYSETTYKHEKNTLGLNEFGAYTELRDGIAPLKKIAEPLWLKKRRTDHTDTGVKTQSAQFENENVPQTVHNRHVGKVRLGKVIKVSKDTYVQPDKPEARQSAKLSDLLIALNKKVGGTEQAKITKGRIDKLKARLKTYTPKELVQAAEVIGNDAYLQGDNPRNKRYGTIDYLLRNDEKIAECLEDGVTTTTANISNLAEDINSGKYL